jgi:hypothetical protein
MGAFDWENLGPVVKGNIPMTDLEKAKEQRFWDLAETGPSHKCWKWRGPLDKNGYGSTHLFQKEFKTNRAARVAWRLHNQRDPASLVIDHICRTRACINPTHLRAVSNETNVMENSDSISARNKKKKHCRNGHILSGSRMALRIGKNGKPWRECLDCKMLRARKYRKLSRHAPTERETGE